jgi:hypothetical protein
MKRFSWIAFTLGALLHLYGSKLLFDQAMRYHLGGPEEPMRHAIVVKIGAYLWWPVPMLLRPLLESQNDLSRDYFPVVVLGWSFVVGAIVGVLMPRLRRWVRKSPNQAMQRTAGRSAF